MHKEEAQMKVYGLKNCDTCRRAISELRAAGLAPEMIDIRADGIAEADLAAIVAAFAAGAVNRASTTWRNLPDDVRQGDPATLIAAHPTLLKRPVIQHDGTWYQGWNAAVKASLIGR
jgi:arsenate reductase-like glutaredoxin family protein